MKIALYSLPDIPAGKHNVKDPRLDQVSKMANSKKKTYIQVELTGEDGLADADAIITPQDARTDLVLKDLEFVETRLGRTQDEKEKALLERLKATLEKEEIIFNAVLSAEDKGAICGYSLLTAKPVVVAAQEELQDINGLLARAVRECGFISFFTAGEKESRAWLIKKGASAWEASGEIHSDIQKGFIRAEIIALDDFINAGGETQAKQAGKLRLEQKGYIMQDGDLANFRFNK